MNQKLGLFLSFAILILPSILKSQEALPSAPDTVAASNTIAPLTLKQRFAYAAVQTFGPYKIAEIAAVAGYDQAVNEPKEWGQGGEAYANRFGSEYGYAVVRQTLELAMEAPMHEDPRYFPSRKKGFWKRTASAAAQTFVARTDSGQNQIAWARLSSAGGAAVIGNLWQPTSTHTVSYAFESFGWIIAGDGGYNWLQEFFPFVRPRLSRGL